MKDPDAHPLEGLQVTEAMAEDQMLEGQRSVLGMVRTGMDPCTEPAGTDLLFFLWAQGRHGDGLPETAGQLHRNLDGDQDALVLS